MLAFDFERHATDRFVSKKNKSILRVEQIVQAKKLIRFVRSFSSVVRHHCAVFSCIVRCQINNDSFVIRFAELTRCFISLHPENFVRDIMCTDNVQKVPRKTSLYTDHRLNKVYL